MLQTIDVLIGFTVVMLILSAVVTMLVQFVATTLLNLKGQSLKDGIAQLLTLLDKQGLTAREANRIADHILRNSLLSRKVPFVEKWRLASVVHREELTTLILDFAAGADLSKADALAKGESLNDTGPDYLRARLLNSLRNNGVIEPPADILKAVRRTMLTLEERQPELANDIRHSVALLTHASSEFLAKTNAWFDQTIDRTVDAFTTSARVWTIIFSAAVAIFFQVNSFELIRRLSVDDDMRQMLVSAAITDPDRFAPRTAEADAGSAPEMNAQPSTNGAPTNATDTSVEGSPSLLPTNRATGLDANDERAGARDEPPPGLTPSEALDRIRGDESLSWLVNADLITWPKDFNVWRQYWTSAPSLYEQLVRLLGVLLTVSLLGLGAPIWYEFLKNLINLRSVVARKDDAQRLERQTSQPPPPSTPVSGLVSRPAGAAGEMGDLDAAG